MANMEQPSMARPEKPLKEQNLQELWQEYRELMDMLPSYFANAKVKMDTMRAAGIPDRAEYEKIRGDLLETNNRFEEMAHRVFDLKDEIQKTYTEAMNADAQWHEEQKERAGLPLEQYEVEVEKLLAAAIELEEQAAFYEKRGSLEQNRTIVRGVLQDLLQRLKDLDAKRTDDEPSRERDSLIELLTKLDNEYLSTTPEAVAASSPTETLRATHQHVKAKYVAVQHVLTVDQRRDMRARIAQLSALVLQAEDAERPATYNPPPPPEPPAPEVAIRAAIQLAMSRAASTAPVIASAVAPPKGGLLTALGDVFKLR